MRLSLPAYGEDPLFRSGANGGRVLVEGVPAKSLAPVVTTALYLVPSLRLLVGLNVASLVVGP